MKKLTVFLVIVFLSCSLNVSADDVGMPLLTASESRADDDSEDFTYGHFTFRVLSKESRTVELEEYSGNETEIEIPSDVSGYTVIQIGDGAFKDRTDLKKVILPNSIETIGRSAFSGCNLLTHINIPNSVTVIKDRAFGYCNHLPSIEFPESLKEIWSGAFIYCSKLETVTIPKSVEKLGAGAFAICDKLMSINIDKDNPNYCSIEGVVYSPDNSTLIMCPAGLYYFDVPDFVGRIFEYAFYGCNNIKSVNIPQTVKTIDPFAFQQCWGLESIEIPNSITEIGKYTFIGCENLKEVVLPSTIKSIDLGGFAQCYSLTNIYSYAEVPPAADEDAFIQSAKATVYVPENSLNLYRDAAGWNYFFDFSAISAVKSIESIKSNEIVFDLYGHRVMNRLKGQVYIVIKGSEIKKIIE